MTTPQPAALQPQPAALSDADLDEIIDRVSGAVGWSPGGWDAVDPRKLVRAILALRPAQQATPEPVGEPFGHVYRYVNDVQAARAEWPDKEPYWLWKFAMGAAPGTPGVEAEEINLYVKNGGAA